MDRKNHYLWLRQDPEYARAFEGIQEEASDALKDEAARRAFAGSDTLLIFLLKARRPEKFRERQDVKTGWDGDLSKLTQKQVKNVIRQLTEMKAKLLVEQEAKAAELEQQRLLGQPKELPPSPLQ